MYLFPMILSDKYLFIKGIKEIIRSIAYKKHKLCSLVLYNHMFLKGNP